MYLQLQGLLRGQALPPASEVPMMADDERSWALIHAAQGAKEWHAAVAAQVDARPDHAEIYTLSSDVVETLRSLDSMLGVLVDHVRHYDVGRSIYDDQGQDPRMRLMLAVAQLAAARTALQLADRNVNEFWSTIGHIGVKLK